MEATVDSILTTTPFFRPREGCEPKPMISMLLSLLISPTSATTFDVPMSRPTIRLRSLFFLDIAPYPRILVGMITAAHPSGSSPANGKAIAVTHVHIRHIATACGNHRTGCTNESFQSCRGIFTTQSHFNTVAQ